MMTNPHANQIDDGDLAIDPHRIVRIPKACLMLGDISRRHFENEFIKTGRLDLVRITEKILGVRYDQLCAIIESLPRGMTAKPPQLVRQKQQTEPNAPPKPKKKHLRARKGAAAARAVAGMT
jgi:hypothetical protein